MLSDRPQAKFCFKSDLNRILIDFFDWIAAARYTRRDDVIQIRIVIISKKSIYIEKESILIEFNQLIRYKLTFLIVTSTFSIF